MRTFLDPIFDILVRVLFFPISIGESTVTVAGILLSLLLLIPAFLLSSAVRHFLTTKVLRRFEGIEPATEFLVLKITHYVIMTVAAFAILSTVGFDLSGLTVIVGLLSVGIGFGLQNFVADFVAGLIILFEQPIRVGEWVEVNGREGEVKEINLRGTSIETLDATYLIIPNQKILNETIVNNTQGLPYIRFATDVVVDDATDVKQVRDLLLKIAISHPKVLKDPAPEVWLTAFGDNALRFRILTAIKAPKERSRIHADLTAAVWDALRMANIEIAYPKHELLIRSATPIAVGESPTNGPTQKD